MFPLKVAFEVLDAPVMSARKDSDGSASALDDAVAVRVDEDAKSSKSTKAYAYNLIARCTHSRIQIFIDATLK